MGPAEFIYIGIRKGDGAMRAMCCDDEGCEEQTAEIVADWIKRGLIVMRLSDADYRARLKTIRNASRACAIGAAPVAQAVNTQSGDEE
jgi:hypothetical protein